MFSPSREGGDCARGLRWGCLVLRAAILMNRASDPEQIRKLDGPFVPPWANPPGATPSILRLQRRTFCAPITNRSSGGRDIICSRTFSLSFFQFRVDASIEFFACRNFPIVPSLDRTLAL